MVRKINLYGNHILTKPCVPCTLKDVNSLTGAFTTTDSVWPDEIVELVQDLKDTAMSDPVNTLGLAAPQIWYKDTPCPAVFVVRLNIGTIDKPNYIYQELINPIVKPSGQTVHIEERCLSVPNFKKYVKRKLNVTVTYQTLQSAEKITVKIFGKADFNAIVIQHEYDHLLGKLIKK